MNKIKDMTRQIARAVWSHRAGYAFLAGTYGAGCLGLDKETVMLLATLGYVALTIRG